MLGMEKKEKEVVGRGQKRKTQTLKSIVGLKYPRYKGKLKEKGNRRVRKTPRKPENQNSINN